MIPAAIILGCLAGLVGLIFLVGSWLPRQHVVARSITLDQSTDTIWRTITDFARVPSWQPRVVKVERLSDQHGRETWSETYKGCPPLILETLESATARRLVRSIADTKKVFSGRWEFDLEPSGGGTRLTITEVGEVPNPFFRFMARAFMDPAKYVEEYLAALAVHFHQQAPIEKAA